ncbi:MAG: divalent-cation tolerance protein CutA [Bauldia sp.]|nr:divalent-cation tolerance protein CutA [Bauldia sp.]
MTATTGGSGTTVSIHATFPDLATAERVGRDVVESGLAACVNILPGARSIYRWKGAIETADEVVAFFKTRGDLADRLCGAIAERHPYDTPAIVVLPVVGGSTRYLDWIVAETAGVR